MHYNPHSFKWFQANLLTLNFNKTKFVQFLTKSNQSALDSIDFDDYHIEISQSTSFWGLF